MPSKEFHRISNKICKMLEGIPNDSKGCRRISNYSKGLHKISKDFKEFQKILDEAIGFQWIRM